MNEIIFLFVDGYPTHHSENIGEIIKYIFDEIGEIKSISYGWHGKEFIDLYKNIEDIKKNFEWHSGIYGMIGDRFFNKDGEEFTIFALDGMNYLYELKQGYDSYSGELLVERLKQYCEKNNMKFE